MEVQPTAVADERRHRTGLVMLFTGCGKGKTTAALGTLLRSWGWGWRTAVIQFIKAEGSEWGEIRAARRLGVEWHTTGAGFTWDKRDLAADAERARAAWEMAQGLIVSGDYDLVVLDEMTYPLSFGWLDQSAVLDWLSHNRPSHTTVVMTGRDAPPALVEFADLATDMRNLKHPHQRGLDAQRGLEY